MITQRQAQERRTALRSKMKGTMATQADAFKQEVDAMNKQRPAAATTDAGPGLGLTIVMMLFSPFLSMVQFGTMFSAIGLLAVGYSLYLAWKQTDGQGMHLALSGPFRVGQGPIPAR